ncbi:MAG TPA: histidine kinase [Propionibacteriaceae bacterium]|nr:histidine kinase [Propionibacteriaceae bacterium]
MNVVRAMRAFRDANDDWRVDLLLAGAFLALGFVPYAILDPLFDYGPTNRTVALVTSFIAFLAITIRRAFPLVFMAVAAAALLVQVALDPVPAVGIAVVPLVAYTVARWVPGRRARLVVVLGALGAVVAPLRWIVVPFGIGQPVVTIAAILASGVCVGVVITPYALGRRQRDVVSARATLLEAEAEHVRTLMSQREHEARAIEARTRNQIARELHDVVAHSLSVMVVQAEGGYALAAKRPEAAAAALGTIAATGREALTEMRRIVAVLREGDDAYEPYTPVPTLADIPPMVDKTGAALTVTGQMPEVPAAVGLTAYRVVQEALTNVLKHAGPRADPRVHVTYSPHGIDLDVVDSGLGVKATADGAGHGQRGMAERLAALGGTIEVGPRKDKGYRVHAWLPVPAGSSGRIDA